MRIAFLNPWQNAAENHAFRSLHQAAARIGHEFIQCRNSRDVDACKPDFVLASASTQPKLNDVPHYGVIHEPRDRFLTSREYFMNLLTYDGYLTVAESLERFLRDLSYGVGRAQEVGFYYNTSQRFDCVTDLEMLLRNHALVITYFGTNWDHRRANFFRMLSELDGVQICGPAHSWPGINPVAYGGAVDFDGVSVQARYAANGIGLCLLSDLHLRDDVVSNRIFEITSVGAIAICCDVPWIRKHYGDSVYYFDQNLPDRLLVKAIQRCRLEIYAHPELALARAQRARQIFEQKFAAEILIQNTVDYHERLSGARRAAVTRAKGIYEPLISVIIRCGGRPIELVCRAVTALARQSYGQFEVIFVRYQHIDLSPLLEKQWPGIHSMKVLDCYAGDRSATLWMGLSAVSGDYFAVLDDDDWLFSDHFERLFQPFPTSQQAGFFAYCGSISEHSEPKPIMGGGTDRRELFKFGIDESQPFTKVSAAFASNCFVASRDLLHTDLLNSPGMHTGEDSFLILSLLAKAEPRFSYAATSVHERGRDDQSNFAMHPLRFEDQLTLRTRLFGKHRAPFAKGDGWAELSAFWNRRPNKAEPLETPERVIHRIVDSALSMIPEGMRDCVSSGFEIRGSKFWSSSKAGDSDIGSARIRCAARRWAYGAALALRVPETLNGEHLLVAEVNVERGEVGLGLLNAKETDFVFRRPVKADPRIQEVHIPILDFAAVGRLVVQNWDYPGESIATVRSVKVFA